MQLTPNVKKLVTRKMSFIAIPRGGTVHDGLNFLTHPERITSAAKEATKWVEESINAIKSAPNNPYTSDEEIAGEILHQIELQKAKVKSHA
jgi:hypothetical protein